MAYIVSHDGLGRAYQDSPTPPDSFVPMTPTHSPVRHSISPQIYGELPCQDLKAHCPACGCPDMSLMTYQNFSHESMPTNPAALSPLKRPNSCRSRTTQHQWPYSNQHPQQSHDGYNRFRLDAIPDDDLYFDQVEKFIARQRALISDGWRIEDVFGKETVSVQAFFAPEEDLIEPTTVAEWVVYATRAPDTLGVPERLGFMLLGALLLRWRIAPTAQNYIMLPAFMRPTSTQLAVPHNAWIDFLPWPEVRDAMILSPNEYVKVAQNRMYLFGLISANWRKSPAKIIASSKHDDRVALSFGFQHHVCDGSNWTIDEEAAAFSSVFASKHRVR